MQLLTDAAFERLAVLGERLHTGLQATVERLGLALAVTSAGSLVSLDIGAAVRADPLQSAASAEFMRLVQLALLVRGIKTSGLLAVSTVTTEAEIDRLVESTADVLDRCGSAIPALLRATPQPV
jgi:glutamate-1-semialdehyde aminotransferase